jgi:CubicO group peptidase (beta-lactamase class C family)/dienelactone hydrolase
MVNAAILAAALTAAPAEVEKRIERVVNGLLPDTAFRRRWGAPAKLEDRMARLHTPGIGIAVVNEGRIEWARGFGRREAGRPDPVSERTLFQAGSISKPIFALGVVRLAQQGTLDLDADVNGYLRTWKVPPNGSWQPRVTLRQILTHSAGLTVHGFPGYRTTEPLPSLVDVLEGRPPANTDPVRVNLLPGTQWRYAGGGTTVGQLAVTELVGKPFPEIMRELVLGPLGMSDSTYEQPLPAARSAAAATAHPWKGDPLPGRWHVYPEMAAAGLWTTPSDLARAGIEMQKALRGESTFLSKERAAQMLSSTVQDDMGIGFFLEGKGETQRFGHGGWDEGFVAKATFYKDRGQGAVVMINSNEGFVLLDEVLRAVAKEYGWPGFFEEEEKAVTAPSEALDRYAGEYTAAGGFRATVTRREGGLLLAREGQPPLELWPASQDRFFARALNADVAFEKGEKAVKLKLKQDGRETVVEKVSSIAAASAPATTARAAEDFEARAALFAYDSGAPLNVKEVGIEKRDGATVHDITFAALPGGGDAVKAYLVVPEGKGPFAGVLWVHWLGEPETTNRRQYLREAVSLAPRGIVSLLVDAMWSADDWYRKRIPEQDYDNSIRQVVALRRAMDLLSSRPDVDKTRLGFVGHDYGGMFGMLTAGLDRRAKTYVYVAVAPSLSHWAFFGRQPASKVDYLRQNAVLELTDYLQEVKNASTLFQFAKSDAYVSRADTAIVLNAAADPKERRFYEADHAMNVAPIAEERDAWLLKELTGR